MPLRISHETGKLVKYVIADGVDARELKGKVEYARERRKVEKPAELGSFYSVQQVAATLAVSEETVRNIFQDKPGVVRITKGKRSRGKREYVTLRIPATLLDAYLRGA